MWSKQPYVNFCNQNQPSVYCEIHIYINQQPLIMKKFISIKALLILMLVVSGTSCSDDETNTTPTSVDFAITPEAVEFGSTGGHRMINVHINPGTEWTLTNTADWLSIEETSGAGMAHFNFIAAPNETQEERTTTVTASNGSQNINVQVKQLATATTEFVYDITPDPSNMSDMSSVAFAQAMGTGWNLGNTLEAIGGETAWGNPMASQTLINGVKAAGFNTIRIPVAWSTFSDASNYTIDPTWMARVQEVVDYAISIDMYVIMNEHWDGGWMQPTYAQQDYVNDRLAKMWKQIATHFRDYDYHLIFAGTNEVMVEGDYGTPTAEYYTVQNSFNQTFVTTVRATGGRNAYRYLTVQGFNTNINHTVNFAQMPDDVTADRMLMEVHFYDPYNFSLNAESTITQWGANATDPNLTETWADESYVAAQFQSMKTNFTDNGIGVILGEYGAISRTDVPGHQAFRLDWVSYVSNSAREHGLVPVWWDNGLPYNNNSMGIFDRNTGAVTDTDIVNAIVD